LLYIASAFGSAICVNIFIFGRISGGQFNPAVTMALLILGKIRPLRALLLVVAQVVAGIAAAGLTIGLVNEGLYVRCSLADGVTIPRGLFIETFMTAQLVLTVLMMAVEKNENVTIAALAIGLSVFIAHIGSVYYTGTSINPARAFGPSVVTGTFQTYAWIYYVGPMLGSAIASGFFIVIKGLRYEEVVLQESETANLVWRQRKPSELLRNASSQPRFGSSRTMTASASASASDNAVPGKVENV